MDVLLRTLLPPPPQYISSVLASLGVSLHPAAAAFAELACLPARALSKLVDASAATYATPTPLLPGTGGGGAGRGGVVARAASQQRGRPAPAPPQPAPDSEAGRAAREAGLRRLVAGMRGVMVSAQF